MCAQVLESLQDGASHDALVSCAGYILGEYGRLVPEVPTHVQFALLQERFPVVSTETKVCILAEFSFGYAARHSITWLAHLREL